MTNEELEEVLENLKYMISEECTDSRWSFIDEIECAIQALEKRIPKDPLVYDTENTMMYELPWDDSCGYECPCCGSRYIDYGYMFCECGQALKWE